MQGVQGSVLVWIRGCHLILDMPVGKEGFILWLSIRLPCRGWLQEVDATVSVASNKETFPGQNQSAGKA